MVSLQPLWKQSDIFRPVRPYMIWILFSFSFEFIISHLPLLVDYALAIAILSFCSSNHCGILSKKESQCITSPCVHTLLWPSHSDWLGPVTYFDHWDKSKYDIRGGLINTTHWEPFPPWMLVEEAWITLLFHEWHTAQFPSLFLPTSTQPPDMQWAQHMSEFRGHGISCYSWAQPKLLSFVTNTDVVLSH